MKNIVVPMPMGLLDQGLLFTAGAATNYRGCQVFGMLVTARCDLEREKTQTFQYVPVVEVSDWMRRDFVWLACKSLLKDQTASLRQALTQAAKSPEILMAQTPRAVLDRLFPLEACTDKASIKNRERVVNYVERLDMLESLSTTEPQNIQLAPLYQHFDKQCRALVRQLVRQTLPGYYFLRSVEPNPPKRGEYAQDTGFVALLRELRHVPTAAARSVAVGLTSEGYTRLCEQDPACVGSLDMDVVDFAMPIGCVRSPEIEHLMQQFTQLFARIGVEDPDSEYIEALSDRFSGRKEATCRL